LATAQWTLRDIGNGAMNPPRYWQERYEPCTMMSVGSSQRMGKLSSAFEKPTKVPLILSAWLISLGPYEISLSLQDSHEIGDHSLDTYSDIVQFLKWDFRCIGPCSFGCVYNFPQASSQPKYKVTSHLAYENVPTRS
jgi:hypothetical protein